MNNEEPPEEDVERPKRRVRFAEDVETYCEARSSFQGSVEEFGDDVAEVAGQGGRGCLATLQNSAKALKAEVLALYYAVHDARTPWYSRLIPVLALAYALSPLDLIPDFIPVLGFLDDLILLPVLLYISIKLIPKEVMDDARACARDRPLWLHENWVVATIIFLMWLGLIDWLLHVIWSHYLGGEYDDMQVWVLGAVSVVSCTLYIVWCIYTAAQHRAKQQQILQEPLLAGEEEGSTASGD